MLVPSSVDFVVRRDLAVGEVADCLLLGTHHLEIIEELPEIVAHRFDEHLKSLLFDCHAFVPADYHYSLDDIFLGRLLESHIVAVVGQGSHFGVLDGGGYGKDLSA